MLAINPSTDGVLWPMARHLVLWRLPIGSGNLPFILFHISPRRLPQFCRDGLGCFRHVGNQITEIDCRKIVSYTLCNDILQQLSLQYEHRNRILLVVSKRAMNFCSLLPRFQFDWVATRSGDRLIQQIGNVISSLGVGRLTRISSALAFTRSSHWAMTQSLFSAMTSGRRLMLAEADPLGLSPGRFWSSIITLHRRHAILSDFQ